MEKKGIDMWEKGIDIQRSECEMYSVCEIEKSKFVGKWNWRKRKLCMRKVELICGRKKI